MTSTINKAETS